MHGRFRRGAAALTLIAGAGACTTPHHSNALIFGTNTAFGLQVGTDATAAPSINVGYRRQEAVFMPLVATASYGADGTPVPCIIGPNQQRGGVPVNQATPPCFLVGRHEGAIDSYSVLASFGADFSANGTNTTAGGGLAQFFATGIAAQALAIRGGPALVATGSAAAAQTQTNVNGALAGLFNDPEIVRGAEQGVVVAQGIRDQVATFLRDQTNDQNFLDELRRVEDLAGVAGLISESCDSGGRQACLGFIGSSRAAGLINQHGGGFPRAIQQRLNERSANP
jgi:hypothetical protein